MLLPYPKATAKSVVDMSKAATLQFGASTCPVTQKLSRANAKRAEDVCHKTFFADIVIFFFLVMTWYDPQFSLVDIFWSLLSH